MTTPTPLKMSKLGAGLYLAGDYIIGRSLTGAWRWASVSDVALVGPWCGTRREATAALAAHLAQAQDCYVCGGATFLTGEPGPCPGCAGTGRRPVPPPAPKP